MGKSDGGRAKGYGQGKEFTRRKMDNGKCGK